MRIRWILESHNIMDPMLETTGELSDALWLYAVEAIARASPTLYSGIRDLLHHTITQHSPYSI